MIDSHCHLHYAFEKSLETLIQEAQSAGLQGLLTVATDSDSIPLLAPLCEKVQRFSSLQMGFSVGIHPHDTTPFAQIGAEQIPKWILKQAIHPLCWAVGEIGLDAYRLPPGHSLEAQERLLTLQLETAKKVQLPVIIHSRDAEPQLGAALTAYAQGLSYPPGVIHCFTGSPEFAHHCLALGFYLSFSGILTFKKATALQALAKTLPLERLLIETDSPYLAPEPLRGKPCEPSMVRYTAAKLAEIKDLSLAEVIQTTTQNTQRCFPKMKASAARTHPPH